MSIIALLIGILIPSLSRARREAKKVKTLAHLRGIGVSMSVYETENQDRLPVLADPEEKAFLGLSLLGKDFLFPATYYVNPNTGDTPPEDRSDDRRPVLADLAGEEITETSAVNPANIGDVGWHCSYAYDNDPKGGRALRRTRVYMGDRADYEHGRTMSDNWNGDGMCLLWTDQHAEFRRHRSLPEQGDPNIYHHNEFEGEGADEVRDGVAVGRGTVDTHLRFFNEEEDDELLPD